MFYSILKELRSTDEVILCTVIDGEHIGEHCLYVNGSVLRKTPHFPENAGKEDPHGRSVCTVTEGGVRILREVLGSRKQVILCGGGHVAQALLKILVLLGIETTVLEDRASFAEEARANGADHVMVGSYGTMLRELDPGKDGCFVVMTRGHRFDMECLYEVLKKEFAYAGMMSSRLRVGAALELMREKGIPGEKLAALKAPIGFKIGAETPEEIAVSIAAELIETLHRQGRKAISKEILNALTEEKRKVLAEIVSRKGPAPRLPGTRMVIFEDGQLAGTIGGGCFEAEVIREARDLMASGGSTQIVTIDLTPEGSEGGEGMACGGTMEVLLEVIAANDEERAADPVHG